MLFAYSGSDLIISEEDYLSLFADVNPEGSANINDLASHPKKSYQFTLVDGTSSLTPSAISNSPRVFHLVKTNSNGSRYSEKLVYCQEHFEDNSEPSPTSTSGMARQELGLREDVSDSNLNSDNLSSSVTTRFLKGMPEQESDFAWNNINTSIAPGSDFDASSWSMDNQQQHQQPDWATLESSSSTTYAFSTVFAATLNPV
ncbi:hypothetical protein J3R30DRAFT_2364978 [Lentinula aciculospora]|uniref:Uncharacterized protein n=1 Tax=Lentinula aciculospora TaxID=153920 RepID=A0A9W9AFF9_9AGAR|nr:hypothetical protein J3R30DRAFT_2364978 [Lentinula aciculospora]